MGLKRNLSICLFVALASAAYADNSRLEKAKSAIEAYFDAILKGESTLSPNIAMSMAVQEVPEQDQSSLQDHYDTVSMSAARQAVDAYVKEASNGQDTSNAGDRMHQIEDALSPENKEKIKAYFELRSERSTAK